MNIHQLSVNYLQEQDRILVRINTTAHEELRLWFTRRLSLGLLPLLSKIVADQTAKLEAIKPDRISPIATADAQTKLMLAEFKSQELLQKADFKTPYKDQPVAMPLGSEPLLVTEVNVTPLPTGQLQIKFNEKIPLADSQTAQQRGFQVSLEQNLVHGFLHLLDKAVGVSQWSAVVSASASNTPANLSGDELVTMEKPKYLN